MAEQHGVEKPMAAKSDAHIEDFCVQIFLGLYILYYEYYDASAAAAAPNITHNL